MESDSLYNVDFRSSLLPSEFIIAAYDISLNYKLSLPDASIDSDVTINGEVYKCRANLSWKDESATTEFQLATNAGYGFENAFLSSSYEKTGKLFSFLTKFTVDDSDLFHVVIKGNSYPNQISTKLVLPDSLFLPLVKELSVGYNLTEDHKSVFFNYLSNSNMKTKFNFLMALSSQECNIILGRVKVNDEGMYQSDRFEFSFLLARDKVDFKTSLVLESDHVFTVFYQKQLPKETEMTIPLLIFNVQKHHAWNITISQISKIMFAGIISPNYISLITRHPSTVYHHQFPLSELLINRSVEDDKYLVVHYKNNQMAEASFEYTDILKNITYLIKNKMQLTEVAYVTAILNNEVVSLHQVKTCERYSKHTDACVKVNYQAEVTGPWKEWKLRRMSYSLDTEVGEILGEVTTTEKNFTINGKAQINPEAFICSRINFFLNSSSHLKDSVSVIYETNCLNAIYIGYNFFKKENHEIKVNILNANKKLSGFEITGVNLLNFKNFNLSCELQLNSLNINGVIEQDSFQILLKSIQNDPHNSKYTVSLESSYEDLRILLINLEAGKDNVSNKLFSGSFKIKGTKLTSDSAFYVSRSDDGSITCYFDSDTDISVIVNLNSRKELFVKISNRGKLFEGKGRINYLCDGGTISGDMVVSVDGKQYQSSFERSVTPHLNKASIKLITPSDDYYVEFKVASQNDNYQTASIKYKTPFYPIYFADINIQYSNNIVVAKEHLSTAELRPDFQDESFDISYEQMAVSLFLKTKHFAVDDMKLSIFQGAKSGILFTFQSKKIEVSFSKMGNSNSTHAFEEGIIDVQGFETSLQIFKGKSSFIIYLNKLDKIFFTVIETPVSDKIIISSIQRAFKSSVLLDDSEKSTNHEMIQRHTIEIVFGQKTILSIVDLQAANVNHGTSNNSRVFSAIGDWSNGNSLRFNLKSLHYFGNRDVKFELQLQNKNQTVIDSELRYSSQYDKHTWIKAFNLSVNKFLSIPAHYLISPNIVVGQEITEESLIKYNLNFTNGLQNELYHFSGNCSLSLPDLKRFSLHSNPSFHADLFVESSLTQYVVTTDILLNHNKLDGSIKWKRGLREIDSQDPIYRTIIFGGFLKDNSFDIYLNKNKFSGSVESSENITLVSAYFENEKLDKNFTFSSKIQYSPVFLLTISHTIFDSPCSVEVKVDRHPSSYESAMTILYNNLNQQAFINVYLDSNPRYVELMYIDIWEQTHEASVYVEEKDSEVTVRGKINSPSLDENFMIVTVGKNNDKLDLNINDGLIVKVFKDNSIGTLDTHFGNDYKLYYKIGNEVEISLLSPKVNASLSFSCMKIDSTSFVVASFDMDMYNFLVAGDNRKLSVSLKENGLNILESQVEFVNTDQLVELQFRWNYFDKKNKFTIKHIYNPVLLYIQLSSPHFLKSNLEIVLGTKHDDGVVSGILEINEQTTLLNCYVTLNKENRTIEVSFGAPLFSRMDSGKINGVFNVLHSGEYELKLSAALMSEDTNLAEVSAYMVRNEETFTTGFTMDSILEGYESAEVSVYLPVQLTSDMKVKVIVHLPFYKPFDLTLTACFTQDGLVGTALAIWQDNVISGEYKQGDPFYHHMFEWKVQYMETKLHIGAWIKPKEPLTDYIYFLDINNKRIIEISHALVLKQNHYKSKLIVKTDFKGHEKYGIDMELQNAKDLKAGKVIRILASAPSFGRDLGIDCGYRYNNLLDYTILAQLRVPYNSKIKMARFHSLHKIQPDMNFIQLNHSLEYTDIGKVGWELESFGSVPFILQGEMSSIDTKVNINNNIYSLKTKSLLQANNIQLVVGLETPFDQLKNGRLEFLGSRQLVGSELMFSVNSNELININFTEDNTNTKQIQILTKWRSIALKYLYESDDGISVSGYVCWDLFKRNTSQLGASVSVGRGSPKYESAVEIILPSEYFPSIGAKTVYEKSKYKLFTLMRIEFSSLLVIEGKFADEVTTDRQQSGLQLQWTAGNNKPKTFGVFYATENSDEEFKKFFTIQHFALENDIMLTMYTKNSLYGINLQYSPLKESEISVEFGYWLVEDHYNHKNRSGVKFVALHPVTNTLVFTVANVTSTTDYIDAGLAISYLPEDETRKIKYVEVFLKRNKIIPELFVGVSSNGNSLAVGASVWKKENHLQGITLQARANQKDPIQLELIQNTMDPEVDIEISYGMSRSYRMSAGLPSSNEITAKFEHTMYGKPNLDALASLRLNSSKMLWGRFECRPISVIGQEFYSGIFEEYSDVTLVSEAIAKGFSDFLHEDFLKKVLLLLNSVSSQSNLLISQTYVEMEIIHNCIDGVRTLTIKAYDVDHFYMKTFHSHLKQAFSTLFSYTSCAAQIVTNVFENVFGPMWSVVERVWQVVQSVAAQWKVFLKELGVGSRSAISQVTELVSYYRKSRANFIHQANLGIAHLRQQLSKWEQNYTEWLALTEVRVNQLCQSVVETFSVYIQRVINYRDTLLAGFSVLGDTIEGMLEIVREGIYRIKEVRSTVEWVVKCVDTVNSWFTNFRLETYLRELEIFVDKVITLIVSDVKRNFGEYEVYVERAQILLDRQYDDLNNVPEILYIKTAINRVYQKLKWFWNYANLSEKLKYEIQKYIESVEGSLESLESQLQKDESNLRSQYVYNAQNNSFTFTQELPFEWHAFNQLPEYDADLSSNPMKFAKHDYSRLVTAVLLPLKQPLVLLPPLKAQALMSTNSFITFDDSFYKFNGECNSYLLASDLYHKTFSLVADYGQQNKRDLKLITKGIEITLKNNLEVLVNGVREDLPLKLSNHITVERKVHSVMIRSSEGFMLECTSFQDMCRFELDWWYMGKTAGLLGTYNHEPSDDFVSPNRLQSESIKQFADSWAIDSNSCESVDEVSSSVEDVRVYESMCGSFFSSQSSPFVPCFDTVDPKAFYHMCMIGARESTCSSVFAYVTKCTASGVLLGWMPEFCVDSSISDATLLSGYTDIIEIPSKMSADIVIVAEQAGCVTSSQPHIDSILKGLNSDLRARGLLDNQFALISFSGQDSQLRTIKGHIWTHSENQLSNAMSQLEADSSDKEASVHLSSALELAASLPFRPGASKMVILLHCSGCPADSINGALMGRFTEGDVVLHVLQQSNLAGKRGKVPSKAIGLEKLGAYPRRIVKNVSPSLELLQQVSVPQDQCTSIVLSTNGTLFSMEVFKKGVKMWTARVAQGAMPTSLWQQCENTVGPDNVPVWRCRATSQRGKLKDYDQTSLDEYMDSSRTSDLFSEYEEVDR